MTIPNTVYMLLYTSKDCFDIETRFPIHKVKVDVPGAVDPPQLVRNMNRALLRKGKHGAIFLEYSKMSENVPHYFAIGLDIEGQWQTTHQDLVIPFEIESTRQDSPLNMYNTNHADALKSLWRNAVYLQLASWPGVKVGYEAGELVVEFPDDDELRSQIRKYIPAWLDPAQHEKVIEEIFTDGKMMTSNSLMFPSAKEDEVNAADQAQQADERIPLFHPRRQIVLTPDVGYGRGFATFDVKTRMDVNPALNLAAIRRKFTQKFLRFIKGDIPKLKITFSYYVPFKKYSQLIYHQGVHAFHLNSWIEQPTESNISEAIAFLVNEGINITPVQRETLRRKAKIHGLVMLETHFRAREDKQVTVYAFPSYVVPILDFNNLEIWDPVMRLEERGTTLNDLYVSLTQIDTQTKAALLHAMANRVCTLLKDIPVLCGGQLKNVAIIAPLEFTPKKASALDFYMPPTDDIPQAIRVINPPEVPVKIKIIENDSEREFLLTGGSVMSLLLHGRSTERVSDVGSVSFDHNDTTKSLQAWSKPNFPDPLRVAVVTPPSHTNAANPGRPVVHRFQVVKGVLTCDYDLIDPGALIRSSDHDPTKNMAVILPRMHKFFGIDPSKVQVKEFITRDEQIVTTEDGDFSPYLEQFQAAVRWGADLLVMLMPRRSMYANDKRVRDALYYWSFKFAQDTKKQIIHIDEFRRDTAFYAMVYSLLAHTAIKFAGQVYAVPLNISLVREAKKPGFIFYDFAGFNRRTVGMIIAGDMGLSSAFASVTTPGNTENDALNNLERDMRGLIERHGWDVVFVFKDNYFKGIEKDQLKALQKQMQCKMIMVNVLKRDLFSGFTLKKEYKGKYYTPISPRGTGIITPDEAVHLFPHDVETQHGLPHAVKLKIEWGSYDLVDNDKDLVTIGTYLAKLSEISAFPHRQKIPTFIHLSDRLAELIEGGAFERLSPGTEIPASFFF